MSTASHYVTLFKRIGLKESKALDTAKNAVLSRKLESIISRVENELLAAQVGPEMGVLLFVLASCKLSESQLEEVLKLIVSKKISSTAQVNAAAEYFKRHVLEDIDVPVLEKACGVGVTYSDSELSKAVVDAIGKMKIEDVDRVRGPIIGLVRKQFKWANVERLNELITQKLANFEPKSDANGAAKVLEKEGNGFKDWRAVLSTIDPKNLYCTGEASKFHKPGENYLSPNYVVTEDTPRYMAQHLEKYGRQVRTRFPPEPNGILHVGHAKSINFNFGYAKAYGGITFLRYDDTNPEKEEEKYFRGIKEMVEWLGFTPYQITHASDHFGVMYKYAKKLIRKGLAYVCHQKHELVKGRAMPISPWRDRPVSESIALFRDMKNGKLKEGEATLRLKYTMEDGKTDPVAYRILYTAHHCTGTKWCIYPMYSYAHPICDSIEGITHSLCTKEFQNQRSFYYWLCNSLDIYCPVQWEFTRLNLTYSVVSKRKILQLVNKGIVCDWDDPRLFTLTGLRRRGIPKEAVNYFCSKVGITCAPNNIDPALLYSCTREVLNVMAKRVMAVLQPLKIEIVNLKNVLTFSVPFHPTDKSMGTRELTLGSSLFIEAADFMLNSDQDFRRLTAQQPVGLMHTGKVLKYVTHVSGSGAEKDLPSLVKCELLDLSDCEKPRAFIHWAHDGVPCSFNLYQELFTEPDPMGAKGGFLSCVNPNSLIVVEGLVERTVTTLPKYTNYQFERMGYFYHDVDSTEGQIKFNRTVTLR